jgi:hypothetical protein
MALPVLSIAARNARTETYYVSPDGDDGNDGLSSGAPKRTLKLTLASLSAHDTLQVLGGSYNSANQGGDGNMKGFQLPADDVYVTAYEEHVPIIDWAGVALSGSDRFLNVVNGAARGTFRGIVFSSWANATPFVYNSSGDSLCFYECVFDGISPADPFAVLRFSSVVGATVDGCSFINRSEGSWSYAIHMQGDGSDDTEEGFVVRDCIFNSEADLGDTLGWSAGLLAIQVNGLVVQDCVGYNAGSDWDANGTAYHFVDLRDVDDAVISGLRFTRYLCLKNQNSWVHNANGIVLGSWSGDRSEDIAISDCAFWGAGHGVHVGNGAEDVNIQQVWCDSTYDDCVFFDDDFARGSASYVVSHYSQDNGIDIQGDSVSVAHCTIVRSRNQAVNVTWLSDGTRLRDNLVYEARDPRVWRDAIAVVDEEALDWAFDHDLWFDPDSAQTMFRFDGAIDTFAAWQAAGHDLNGYWEDPLLCDPEGRAWPMGSGDFQVLATSVAVGNASDGGVIGALGVCGPVVVSESAGPPPGLALSAAPNPFTSAIEFRVRGAPSGDATVSVADVSGRIIRTLDLGSSVVWDGTDRVGRPVAPGVYFVRWRGGASSSRFRIIHLR